MSKNTNDIAQYLLYKALVGDKSDNLVGICSSGKAESYLRYHPDISFPLEYILERGDLLTSDRADLLSSNYNLMDLAYPDNIDLVQGKRDLSGFVDLCERYEFKSFLKTDSYKEYLSW